MVKATSTTGRYTRAREFMGKNATVEFFRHEPGQSILVQVKVRDYKVSYGKERFLIEPVAGKGAVWIQRENLKLTK